MQFPKDLMCIDLMNILAQSYITQVDLVVKKYDTRLIAEQVLLACVKYEIYRQTSQGHVLRLQDETPNLCLRKIFLLSATTRKDRCVWGLYLRRRTARKDSYEASHSRIEWQSTCRYKSDHYCSGVKGLIPGWTYNITQVELVGKKYDTRLIAEQVL
jgi:hypothetical protein